MREKCKKQKGNYIYTCLDLPPRYIRSVIKNWVCKPCAEELIKIAK
jgi:hypothetical protein